jgi:hypothetical protein
MYCSPINRRAINSDDIEHFPSGWSWRCKPHFGYSQIKITTDDFDRQDKDTNHVNAFQVASHKIIGFVVCEKNV